MKTLGWLIGILLFTAFASDRQGLHSGEHLRDSSGQAIGNLTEECNESVCSALVEEGMELPERLQGSLDGREVVLLRKAPVFGKFPRAYWVAFLQGAPKNGRPTSPLEARIQGQLDQARQRLAQLQSDETRAAQDLERARMNARIAMEERMRLERVVAERRALVEAARREVARLERVLQEATGNRKGADKKASDLKSKREANEERFQKENAERREAELREILEELERELEKALPKGKDDPKKSAPPKTK